MSATDKLTTRRNVRREIAKLTMEAKESLSLQIFSKIASMEEVENSSVIALFVSLADEPQTVPFIEQLAGRKRVVVPRIEGEEMEFYDIAEGLQVGAFGIMEPVSETAIEPSEIDVMVVPGVAFTPRGARLGRGKGFYDKYLSRRGFRAFTIGVCYPCQIVDEIATEPHDRVIDRVVTAQ